MRDIVTQISSYQNIQYLLLYLLCETYGQFRATGWLRGGTL
jgi:hypothetical protein